MPAARSISQTPHDMHAKWRPLSAPALCNSYLVINLDKSKRESPVRLSVWNVPVDLKLFSSLFQVTFSVCHFSCPLSKQATHPNMRTYYFCSDTANEMEAWMKVMTDAALLHSEPVKRFVKRSLWVIFTWSLFSIWSWEINRVLFCFWMEKNTFENDIWGQNTIGFVPWFDSLSFFF